MTTLDFAVVRSEVAVRQMRLMDLVPGMIVAGKYRYEHDLGEGGTGRVVAATHLALHQRVALKILTHTTSPRATGRFLREARLAFRLTSPHVTRVLDAGELENGVPYIAMELLDGVDLAKLSHDRGPLPPAEACGYILQACEAIAEAHALGMVHRDVKLANMFLARTPNGSIVKVLDFGCAKAERTSATSIVNATRTDAFLGTPGSMAPEQLASSRDVDARADVWSLGIALYTLLAGRPPFEGATFHALVEQVVKGPTPPIERPLPKGLAEIIERCLRKRPEERFADAGELAFVLAPYAKRAASRAKIIVSIVALVSMSVGVVFFFALHHAPPQPVSMAAQPFASAPSVVASDSTELAPLSPIPSITAAPSKTHAVIAHPRYVFCDPPWPSDVAVDPKVLKGWATYYAGRFCTEAFTTECFTFTSDVCNAELDKIIYACRGDMDHERCIRTAFHKHFDGNRIHSAECTEFD